MRLIKWGCWVALSLLGLACQSGASAEATTRTAEPLAVDSSLAGVFSPWDGHWQGTFTVYRATAGQINTPAMPQITTISELQELNLVLTQEIAVEQRYHSESPFLQRVLIQDTYTDANGESQIVTSSGYNVVRGDSLICVVNKPDEQVVHLGKIPADSIIIWRRSLTDPLKVEYFYERVIGQTYSIVGWGYYGQDDTTASPRTWFSAVYRRVSEE